MPSIEVIVARNAAASGITVAENLRGAKLGQFITRPTAKKHAHSDTATTAALQEIESVKQTLATMTQTLQEVQHSANNFPQPDPRPIDQLISRLQAFEDQTIQRTVTDPIIRQLILLHGLLPEHDSMEDIPVVKAIRASVTDMLNIHGVKVAR